VNNTTGTDWIVVRPEGGIAGSELASVFEGEWRKRASLTDADFLELDGPQGPVRAYPTGETETSPAGDVGEVWRVPGDTGVTPRGRGGLDTPHR
jgi:hypothetical protein